MQDTELFLSLAEIAGVFVGFGALISIRSGATMAAGEVNSIRWVVTIAIWVVIVALAPVIVSRYGITGHELWLVCSLPAVALLAIMMIMYGRTPENPVDTAETRAAWPLALIVLGAGSTIWLPTASLVLALVLVVLGPFPDQEQALYLTAVALGLFMGAIHLFVMVFWRVRPAAPSDQAGLPAPGGSST